MCSEGIPSWPSLCFFSFRSPVCCTPSFLLSLCTFFHFPVINFTYHFPYYSCIPYFPLHFTNKPLTVFSTHSLIPFHCTPTFTLCFTEFLVPCTFCLSARHFSKSHLGFPFWNLLIFFNLVQPFATNKLRSDLL